MTESETKKAGTMRFFARVTLANGLDILEVLRILQHNAEPEAELAEWEFELRKVD